MVAIFTYNLPKAIRRFEEEQCKLITLSDYDVLIEKALEVGHVSNEDLKILNEFKDVVG